MSRLCVVVPTYNEAENLPRLTEHIRKALKNWDFKIVIVDDNSPDGTARVAKKLGKLYGNIIVKVRAEKSGLGSALSDGLKMALSVKEVDKIVTLDADFSHAPCEIPKLLQAAQEADLIQGSRYTKTGVVAGWGVKRRLISCIANLICRLLLRTSPSDCTGNFRVYSRECAEAIVKSAISKGFEWVIEAMLVARRNGFAVKETPITFIDRKNGKTKLKASEILTWGKFALKSLLSLRSSAVCHSDQSRTAIHKSSALTMAVTPPTTSTTK